MCYKEFPLVQRAQEVYSPQKLQVVLLSTDQSRSYYDAQTPALFERYGGGDWPSVVLPNGMEGAMRFGDFGYGKIIVDAQGIVRSINEHKMKPTLEKIFAE